MRWLIVEDALQDRKGHWFEYVRIFREGLLNLGDTVTVLVSRKAEPFICSQLDARAVLPESIWHRSGTGNAMERWMSIPLHAWEIWKSLKQELRKNNDYDIIFVPTVSVHHLLGWGIILKCLSQSERSRILLYFLSIPLQVNESGKSYWNNSLTARMMAWLLQILRPDVESGKLILGVETKALQEALSKVTSLTVQLLPQPVEALMRSNESLPNGKLLFACYGAARHEKGSDLLQAAIILYRKKHPYSRIHFAIQWVEDFNDAQGEMVFKSPILLEDESVEFITTYFADGEYPRRLEQTGAILLPYRSSSYRLRGSRVVIEAMVNGIPVVVTRNTTLAEQARTFGASVLCDDNSVEGIVEAIEYMEQNYESLKIQAREKQFKAQEYFSVGNFRRMLVA